MIKVAFISSIVAAAMSTMSLMPLASSNPGASVSSDSNSGEVSVSAKSSVESSIESLAEGHKFKWARGNRASAKALSHGQITKVANKIDKLVEAKLTENSQSRNALTNDATFLRRIYLDVVGRIPTLSETEAFLDSKKPNKRAMLIDELLDSYGHVSHQFNFWADLLRIKSNHMNVTGQPYIDFVKDSLESNKPYDQLVRELITSEGPLMERDNGAVGYYMRDKGMPEDNMSNTIRVFLGTRLECAQCHDHPFDDWTQRQYYEMVAFTGGMMTKLSGYDSKFASELKGKGRKELAGLDEEQRRLLRRFLQPMQYGVTGSGTGLTVLPENYMGDDGEEYDIVKAKTMFEGKPLVDPVLPPARKGRKKGQDKSRKQAVRRAKPIDSRTVYAQWLTDSENPRFTKVMANRLWKQAMGLGLIEPADDMTKHTKASNPALMEYLSDTFEELDYDMKQFQRAIYNSKTYQARAMREDVPDPDKFYFNGPIVRRMAAEQVWDSLLTLTIPEVDQRRTMGEFRYGLNYGDGDIYQQYARIREMSFSEILDKVKSPRGKRQGNSEMMSIRKKSGSSIRFQLKQLGKQIAQAQKNGNRKELASLTKQMNELTQKSRSNGKFATQLNRASEIRSPAPAGHFLREFGQSDRETIQNANTQPAVTQALSLMNGVLENRVANNPSTVLMQDLIQARGSERAVEIVFLSMLNREPTSKESSVWESDFKSHPKKVVLSDLIWTLANSNEFIFIK